MLIQHGKIVRWNIFYRELTHAPGRGVDVLGYEQESNDIALIVCEVKGSQDSA